MEYIVRQGQHRAKPTAFALWHDKKVLEREVIFDKSCEYTLPAYNQEDVNKLFGLGFCTGGQAFSAIKGIFGQSQIPDEFHHTDSARFGWSFDPVSKLIQIHTYCYVDKNRISEKLIAVPTGERILFRIEKTPRNYKFVVDFGHIHIERAIPYSHDKKWSYLLGFYFGGTQAAPHDIKITRNKT